MPIFAPQIFAVSLYRNSMSRNNKKQAQPILTDLAVSQIAAEGKTIARHPDGRVVFVEGAVPGDVVDVQITKAKKDYVEARMVAVKQASADRVVPFCSHFGVCGGCKWQQLDYPKQAAYKQQLTEDAFRRIGKLTFSPLLPIIAAEATQYYRNKLEFTFSNKRWLSKEDLDSGLPIENRDALGFHIPGMFDKIVDIDHCYLQAEPSNQIRNAVRQYALEHGYTFYDVKQHVGFLRNLIVRTSTLGELMVIVSFGEDKPTEIENLLSFLLQQFNQITSLHYAVNLKFNDTLFDQNIVTHSGRGFIYEELEGLRFKISPKSFFQTNSQQALKLYQTARSFAKLKPTDTVYDLYTGTGSIGIFLAKYCKKVIGIEEIDAAIADAQYNAELNNAHNTHFYAGDVKKLLTQQLVTEHGMPDVLVTDPPRAGMHPDVVQTILDLAPPRIVYVSCNPATQARDLQLLSVKYDIMQVQPVDMFPHTFHIENVVELCLRTES